jgi:hypothetical protein
MAGKSELFILITFYSLNYSLLFSRALTLLKKKRAQEKMIENAMAQIDNVETMVRELI